MKKRFLYTLIALFILIIIGCLYISEGFALSEEPWCVLLTTCVKRKNATPEKTQEILDLYKRSIDLWLKTDLPIVVVDSSDYEFKEYEGRLKVCHFLSKETVSSSIAEAESILYALRCNHTRRYKNIIKITGRYYIDGLQDILNEVGDEHDLYVQHINNPVIAWQNSEVFGFNKNHAEYIFRPIIDNALQMEKRLWEVSHSNYNVEILPPMPNVLKVTRGGDGLLVDPL
jgi:hypothetical protein